MRTRSALIRGIVTVVAIMQMAMPSVASIADAWLEAARPSAAFTHAEDPARSTSTPIHAADCILCAFLIHCAADAPAHAPPSMHVVAVAGTHGRNWIQRMMPAE
jgi:hypothetical protein